MSEGGEARCSCTVKPPRRDHAYDFTKGGYSVYIDVIEDDTQFDPACPFHGDEGTMVVRVDV